MARKLIKRVGLAAAFALSSYLFLWSSLNSVKAASSGVATTITTGRGYVELPVSDTILSVYSKGDDLALDVYRHRAPPALKNSSYAITLTGKIIWSDKNDHKYGPNSAVGHYLTSKGWSLLKLTRKDKPTFADHSTLQRPGRPPVNECITLAKTSLKATAGQVIRQGSFVRFLNKPERQYPFFHCGKLYASDVGDGYAVPVAARLVQDSTFATTYILGPDKFLLVNNTVAVLLRPNLDYYYDHPADYFFLSATDADSIEENALADVVDNNSNTYFDTDIDKKSTTDALSTAIQQLDDALAKALKQ
jgi:hypothetical protein